MANPFARLDDDLLRPRQAHLAPIGRARDRRFVALAGQDRIRFSRDLAAVAEKNIRHRRKAAVHGD